MEENEESPMEEFTRVLLDDGEIKIDPSPDGIGMKASVGHLFSEELDEGEVDRIFVQFYVISTIPKVPADPDVGYTDDEVEFYECVVLADVASRTNPPKYFGEIIPLKRFKDEYITDPELDIRIDRFFSKMKEKVTPRETWLAQASTMYHERMPGMETFIKQKKIC